ncbi:MAG: penicillin-binding protein [Lachnospiraceae bacterium]|nr:penicillin-binding protein [Lachnospiraceae bacterium]
MVRSLIEKIKGLASHVFSSRVFILGAIVCVLFIILIAKLFNIQIVRGEEYRDNYTQLSLTTITNDATRGMICDRNGVPLAYNQVSYAVTITDTGVYANGYEWNEMLRELVPILDRDEARIVNAFPMAYDDYGHPQFTTRTQAEKNTLLMNIYGLGSTEDFDTVDDEGNLRYPSDPEPEEFLRMALERFGIGFNRDRTTYEVDPDTALKMLNIRYAMYLVSYIRYETVTIASDVNQATVTDILEHADTLRDVSISEEVVRVYSDPECFSGILGYTGTASEEELAVLQQEDPTYEIGDVVGRAGIEQVMETDLSGSKGSTTVMVDSRGRIMETLEEHEAVAGDDIYLTLDRDLQVAVYHMLEQSLASIILEHMINDEVDEESYEDSATIPISIYDIYFQMINNNVLSIAHFAADGASPAERAMYISFLTQRERDVNAIAAAFREDGPSEVSEDLRDLLDHVIDRMNEDGILATSNTDESYVSWYHGETSFYELMRHKVTEGLVNVSGIGMENAYAGTHETIEALRSWTLDVLAEDPAFDKLIYEDLIHSHEITGNQICMALYDQGVLEEDAELYERLASGSLDAYSFMQMKIESIEITPAQIALDPCTAACVVLDANSAAPLAVVSYPGYDLNRMSGSIDAAYYSSLLQDGSNPLYNNATQARVAPGSTFKPITAIAALEEGFITPSTQIEDLGVFTEQGMNLHCWFYPETHGMINVREAIMVSCNYFFSELGYEMSFIDEDTYSDAQGLSILRKYAQMFGLDTTTGLEIPENEPQISDFSAIPSAIGQGTHAYTCMNLARYALTLSNRGTLYDLTLLDHRTDYLGETIETYAPEVIGTADVSPSTFETVRSAMNGVVNDGGSCYAIFQGAPVDSAGKTGTAEQSAVRGPHANYIGFAPYDDPEIAYAVMIPFGYTSGHSAEIGRELLNYYFGDVTLDEILEGGAMNLSGVTVRD